MSLKRSKSNGNYSEKQKDIYVKKLLESGYSVHQFCKQVGLIPNTMRNWLKKRGIEYYVTDVCVSCSPDNKAVPQETTLPVASDNECVNSSLSEETRARSAGELTASCIEYNEGTMKESDRRVIELEMRIRELEKENEALKSKYKTTKQRAESAELSSFVLETLIEVANEEYGIDVKKNFGRGRSQK